jgi:hypothetical protein
MRSRVAYKVTTYVPSVLAVKECLPVMGRQIFGLVCAEIAVAVLAAGAAFVVGWEFASVEV